MNKANKHKIWLPLALFSILALGMYMGMLIEERHHRQPTSPHSIKTSRPGIVEEVLGFIEARYMDTVNRAKLEETAILAMLKKLDPHSIYISAEELEGIQEQMSGEFEGIGVEFQIMNDTVVIITPLAGSPAEEAGILPGDKIITVNDSLLAGQGLSSSEVVQHLKGPKGTQVKIGIARPGSDSLLIFSLERAQIPIHSVDAAYMLDTGTGYIKLNRFSANAYTEFMQALDSLVEQHGLKNLVLDLRGNPGGYLPEAIKLLNQLFTEKDILLLYTEGRQSPRHEYTSRGLPLFSIQQIAVLIDEGSASASEIVAGALQDQDRGLIIGRRSFGKGLVQEQYELSNGSALRLTVAHYYTPSGRSIQKPYHSLEDYEHDLIDRQEHGEFFHADSIKIQDSTRYYTKEGREVRGGGGIIPDIFVPLDSIYLDEDFSRLRSRITPFILRVVKLNGKSPYQLPDTEKAFRQSEVISPKMMQDFLAFAKQEGIHLPPEKEQKLQPYLRLYLKAQIARQRFGNNAYYHILNEKDPDVQTALHAIKKSH